MFSNKLDAKQSVGAFLALVAVLVMNGRAVADAPPHGTPSVALAFSDEDKIDRGEFGTRDMSKPFYFQMDGSSTHAPQRFTADIGSTFDAWLDSRVPRTSSGLSHERSLALSLWSDQDRNVKDKIFLDAVRHQSPDSMNARAPNNERFVSFDLMLDKDYQTPLYWVIHFQVLQCCAGHPPFTIKVMPAESNEKTVRMELTIANDETELAGFGKSVQIGTFAMARDKWTHFVLDLKPAPCGEQRSGKVVAWVDQRQITKWDGCWGYRPSSASLSEKGPINDDMQVDVGIYRRRQPNKQTVYIDNFFFGTMIEAIKF